MPRDCPRAIPAAMCRAGAGHPSPRSRRLHPPLRGRPDVDAVLVPAPSRTDEHLPPDLDAASVDVLSRRPAISPRRPPVSKNNRQTGWSRSGTATKARTSSAVNASRAFESSVVGGSGQGNDVAKDVPLPAHHSKERPQGGAGVPPGLPREPALDQRVVHPVVVTLCEQLDPGLPNDRQDPGCPHDVFDGAGVR